MWNRDFLPLFFIGQIVILMMALYVGNRQIDAFLEVIASNKDVAAPSPEDSTAKPAFLMQKKDCLTNGNHDRS